MMGRVNQTLCFRCGVMDGLGEANICMGCCLHTSGINVPDGFITTHAHRMNVFTRRPLCGSLTGKATWRRFYLWEARTQNQFILSET